MKLLWVFSTFAVGGPQRRFASLVPSLSPGIEHVVAAMDGRFDAASLLPPDLNWRKETIEVEKTALVSVGNVRRFRATLKAETPDLLLTSNWGTIEWHFANRGTSAIPHVHFEDGFGPDEAMGRRNWKRDLMRRALFSGVPPFGSKAHFIAPSSGLGEVLSSSWGAPKSRVHVIPNGIDFDLFTPAAAIAKGDATEPLVIGTVGALRREKRMDRLIDLFAKLDGAKSARLLIVGDGPERHSLETQVQALGLTRRVEFAGEQRDVRPFLERMSIFALTSDTEQMPISMVEAMAMALPVLATDVGDVNDMISSENQTYVHAPQDEDALGASLSVLAKDPALRKRLGLANFNKAKKAFSFEAMKSAHWRVYQAAMGGS